MIYFYDQDYNLNYMVNNQSIDISFEIQENSKYKEFCFNFIIRIFEHKKDIRIIEDLSIISITKANIIYDREFGVIAELKEVV